MVRKAKKEVVEEVVEEPVTEEAVTEQPTVEDIFKQLQNQIVSLERQNIYLKGQLELAKEMLGVKANAAS